MFPSSFEYAAPHTLDEALELLSQRGDDARVVAGGQSLIPMMKLRFASPGMLVDLNGIDGLSYIEEEADRLRVGAMTRNSEIERSSLLRSGYPTMSATAPLISDPLVRNRGTIGGSLAHADPAGDWGSAMLAMGAEVVARSTSGERVVPVDELLVDTFTTSLQPGEVITEVRVPRPAGRSGGTYLKLERRVGDFATAAVAIHVELDNGTIRRAGIGLTAVGPRNIRAADAEGMLVGTPPGEEAFAEAARLAADAAEPISDHRGSADYKRAVIRTYVQRGLARSVELAQGR